MKRGTGGASPFLANHGYFVSTLSDDEDEDCWREEGREEHRHAGNMWSPDIQERNMNRWTGFEHQSRHISFNSNHTNYAPDLQHSNIMYLSQLQLKKSKACSEASKYSLQRSLELLMARGIHKADPEEATESPSVQPMSVKVSDTRLQHYVMEPTREVVVTSSRVTTNPVNLGGGHAISAAASNWTRDLEDAIGDDYPDPIDMELYYNQPHRASLHEMHKNQTYRHFTANPVSSELMICDWEDETGQSDRDAYNSHSDMTQPQRECKALTMDPTVYPFRNTASSRRDDITAPKQPPRQFKSCQRPQERGPHGSKGHLTTINSPMLRRVDSVKNYGAISDKGCSSKIREHAHAFVQKFHNSNDDQMTCHQKESRIQDNVPVSPTTRRKHMRSSHHRRGYSKRQHREACHDKGDTRIRCEQVSSVISSPRMQKYRTDTWTLANTEEAYNHDSLRAPCLPKRGAHWDQRNVFWTSQSPVERQQFHQEDVEPGLVNTSNTLDYIIAPERENSATEMRSSKMVKHGVPSTQTAKEQLLSAINLARRARQSSTQSNTSNSTANELSEDKSLDVESPHSKCLRERQLQTLNVMDYKTPERGDRTVNPLVNRTEGTHRPGVDETCDKGMAGNIAPNSDVIDSENSQTNINTCKRINGAISNYLSGKENGNQTENNISAHSGLKEKRSVENRNLPTRSTATEDQRLQISMYSPSQQVEEANVEVQEQSKEPGLIVESNSREVIQVEQYTELAFQSNRLLKLLRELQVQRPEPEKCYEDTSIISTKTDGTTDAAPQCGYLAQYLKMQSIGARGTSRLITTRR